MAEAKHNHRSGERIAKVLARAGVASRREVERMIEAGLVTLKGRPVTTPATLIRGTHGIRVDGRPVDAVQQPMIWRYHKTRSVLTTHRDPQGRPTIFQRLPKDLPRVVAVGRLDMNSEGLLLLTNDGELARLMELPGTGWIRRYRARVHGRVDENRLKSLVAGATVDGVTYGPITARLERAQGANAWLEVSLGEGKNREVRKALGSLGLQVNRLIRTGFGPFELGRLSPGAVRPVSPRMLGSILDDLKGR